MNPYVLDVAERATRGVDLPVSELKILEQGSADIAAAFVAHIKYLERQLNWQEDYIRHLEEKLGLTEGDIDDARADITRAVA